MACYTEWWIKCNINVILCVEFNVLKINKLKNNEIFFEKISKKMVKKFAE